MIARTDIPARMRRERAQVDARRCKRTIKLDGKTYRCGREHVEGIHDAFAEHSDGGAVRW